MNSPQPPSSSAPIFIIGTERSGSNLLRLILNSHQHICVPHPPHIMFYFHEIEAGYGDLENDTNLRRLIKDVGQLIHLHIYPWEIAPSVAEVLPLVQPKNLFGVFTAYYDLYLKFRNKQRWGCKSTFMIHHADRILDKYPAAKLLWLVRDPRDVAVSSKKSVFNPCHPYLTAELWNKQQQLGHDLEQRLTKNNLLRLRYEDLITQPENWCHKICEFLEEPFDPAMLRFFETDDAKKGGGLSESWVNHSRPIMSDNFGKFRKALSQQEIEWIEAASGPLMKELGYPLEYPDQQQKISDSDIYAFKKADRLCRLGIEYRSLLKDKNHWMRWKRAIYMTFLKMVRNKRNPSGTQKE